jgi:16S rRNA (cytidine1402-2'-O)-methyltransferase
MDKKNNPGKLYLIPTVIAPNTHNQVLPATVKTVTNTLKYFLAENVRTARRFLSAWGISRPIHELQFEVLDKRTTENELSELLVPIMRGKDMGLMSEAGCPGVADPGALAVAYAHQHDIKVIPLVGPSSFLLALMGSGFSGQSFAFHGYLPIDKAHRIKVVKKLEKQSRELQQTQIFMETPYRNNQLLDALIRSCKPGTRLCIGSNLSSPDEMLRTRTMKEWKSDRPDLHKKPVVFLLSA